MFGHHDDINEEMDSLKNKLEREIKVRKDMDQYILDARKNMLTRIEILEKLFKESKAYKKAECEILRECAERAKQR